MITFVLLNAQPVLTVTQLLTQQTFQKHHRLPHTWLTLLSVIPTHMKLHSEAGLSDGKLLSKQTPAVHITTESRQTVQPCLALVTCFPMAFFEEGSLEIWRYSS